MYKWKKSTALQLLKFTALLILFYFHTLADPHPLIRGCGSARL